MPGIGNLLMFRGSKRSSFVDVIDVAKKYGRDGTVTLWFENNETVVINDMEGSFFLFFFLRSFHFMCPSLSLSFFCMCPKGKRQSYDALFLGNLEIFIFF